MTCCCVSHCSEIGIHHFPKDNKIKKLWLRAIRRQNFEPTKNSRLCRKHFLENDYQMISKYTGVEHQHRYLKKGAIPSVFSWTSKQLSQQALAREDRYQARNCKRSPFQVPTISSVVKPHEVFVPIELSHEESANIVQKVKMETSEMVNLTDQIVKTQHTQMTQTSNLLRLFTTDLLLEDDESVNYYTGLESVAKFNLVLNTLLPMANHIKYRWSRVNNLSIKDQFLMLLIKLRRNRPDFELSKIFGVNKTEVSCIIITWINFVSDIWSLIDIWPSQELVNVYLPDSFRKHYKSTSVIIDKTEIPIQKPSHPDAQKATFSAHKHKNTLKFLLGASPGNVHDLFANTGVGINIPTFLKKKSQIPSVMLKSDQKLARQRVHIERLIGLSKTYKILTDDLNQFYIPLASKIFNICIMLCNFRGGIVNNKNK